MRFNPPPNWPSPPEGWEPPAGWTPDAAWPPPPEGWELFVEEPVAPDVAAVSRPRTVGDEGEYFGSDRAWSDTGAEPANIAPEDAEASEASNLHASVEVAPDQLSVEHLGRPAMIRWEGDQRYEIGTIVGVSADAAGINVRLDGVDGIPFPRQQTHGAPTNPRLFVWL